ncbi:MAG TPA: hypothetical protein PK367_00360 [Candidatus Paceibacterota bacterium]|nr:hypothetical protein [Candidatus Paceibacterota bacterium]
MFQFINVALGSFYNTLLTVIWIFFPVFLFATWWQLRLFQKRINYVNKVKWIVLEMKVPKDNIKTPKSMEQVFAALYGIYSYTISWHDKYIDGKVNGWLSLEMVGRGGGIHFYARMPSGYQNLFEAAVYAQYPDAEIIEVPDYVDQMPSMLPNKTWDIWGTGFTLAQPNPYPIKTYPFFEEVKDEKRIDPISNIAEVMSKLKDDEMVWIQFIISPAGAPTGHDLKKEGDQLIQDIINSTREPKKDPAALDMGMWKLTPSQQDIIKAISNKISKISFQMSMRFVYIDKKDAFTMSNAGAVMSAFQLYNTRDMNGFRPDRLIPGFTSFWGRIFTNYKKYVVTAKKRKLYDFYRKRRFGYSGGIMDENLPILNTEELATIFHFPISVVKAQKLQTNYSRKGEPPVNLPINKK